ncbi:MAG: hypothetical protein EP329_07155 [Deltaproteobacteria bacterium]|nr:MAG: hypothetical protein EP329_07155 [Deltaproteobacteria bacterium]
MSHRLPLLALGVIAATATVPACTDATGEVCRTAPWDTGEASWTCNEMNRDCSVSPCACERCCPATWYTTREDVCGSGGACYFPQLTSEVVRVDAGDAVLPDTFTAHWASVSPSNDAPTCTGDALIRCGDPASALVLSRDGAANVRVVFSLPVETLAALTPSDPVEIHLHRGSTLGGDTGAINGIEVVDGDGALLLAVHDWMYFGRPERELPHTLHGTGGGTVARAPLAYCLTLPDGCNRTFTAESLLLAGTTVAPEASADVDLGGRAYTLHHARTVHLGGRDEAACADDWPTLVSFSVVRRPE